MCNSHFVSLCNNRGLIVNEFQRFLSLDFCSVDGHRRSSAVETFKYCPIGHAVRSQLRNHGSRRGVAIFLLSAVSCRCISSFHRKYNFCVSDPNSNKRDPDGRNLFLCCVSDLAIECRDYDLLFGKMQRNGIRSRGLIDQFESIEVDPRKACEMVADELVKKGLFEDAIKLYDLADVNRIFRSQINCVRHLITFV